MIDASLGEEEEESSTEGTEGGRGATEGTEKIKSLVIDREENRRAHAPFPATLTVPSGGVFYFTEAAGKSYTPIRLASIHVSQRGTPSDASDHQSDAETNE